MAFSIEDFPTDIIIIDCEASGLDDESYPIQIAWYNPHTDESDSFYIHPKDEWEYWDENAEDVHGIPRKFIIDMGISVDEAQKRLIDKIFDNYNFIYCDCPLYDSFWIYKLFEDSNYVLPKFRHICDLMKTDIDRHILSYKLGHQKRSHDALDDCKNIADAYQLMIEYLTTDDEEE